jgi:hypothetical protein
MTIGDARSVWLRAPVQGVPATITVSLGVRRFFVAQVAVNMLDPRIDYDADNAFAADIPKIDDAFTEIVYWGGIWGPFGDNARNVHTPSFRGWGQTVTFRLRVMGPDESAVATGVVIY